MHGCEITVPKHTEKRSARCSEESDYKIQREEITKNLICKPLHKIYKQIIEDKEELKKYECPTHGPNGNPDCSICWENLGKLLSDMNVYQTGDSITKTTEDLKDVA